MKYEVGTVKYELYCHCISAGVMVECSVGKICPQHIIILPPRIMGSLQQIMQYLLSIKEKVARHLTNASHVIIKLLHHLQLLQRIMIKLLRIIRTLQRKLYKPLHTMLNMPRIHQKR